ncbi:glycoside hydrolase family 5 protein [bacterium]|nr:glycoside hydrolase family 5 protein [bacterium]
MPEDTSKDPVVDDDDSSTGTPTSPSPQFDATAGYTVVDNQVFLGTQKIIFYGINWFGMEEQSYAPHGLWQRDYKDMIAQIKSLGFNSVRLPFCPGTLDGQSNPNINTSGINTDLKNLDSLEVMDKIAAEFNRQKIYILFDFHKFSCGGAITELWYDATYSEQDWINDLTFVAEHFKNLPYFMGIDLKNEPHGVATIGTGNNTDWMKAASKAGTAILNTNPNLLIFIEGIENNPACSDNSVGHWWGGNLEPFNCYTPTLPASKTVYSPHVYGPDVFFQSYFSAPNFPQNMPAIWTKHFGQLSQTKPVIPGEFGGKYQGLDQTWQKALIDYFIEKDMCSFFYWSLNPNSGDTGGILKDDWISVNTDKLNNLKRLINHCKVL